MQHVAGLPFLSGKDLVSFFVFFFCQTKERWLVSTSIETEFSIKFYRCENKPILYLYQLLTGTL